ncbi:lytic transglycosylase domain-containing protein [Mariprofundus ferrinatatus]|uniref:lytic transglycosylase domain-containing protein n=1 Tax=Mariprofundus ferrinatatus TaxID=1921087 RepID=UPI001E5CE7EC|nr:lytic transglycosylase domain-containing protein [Mariprofundus ferrinatatus]
MSPKALLAGVMVAGFLVSLPIWMASTPEDKQHLSQSAVKKMVEQNVDLLDFEPEEKEELRRMLQPGPVDDVPDFERDVWVKDIVQTISPWVPDEKEAETIARWVYVYSKHFDLSPELVLGVIAVESRFDHFAVSNVGAIGLMQVMPFWKNELGSPSDNLLEIETNLRYGCAILRHYIDRYNHLDRALAAYNGSLGKQKYPNKIYKSMKKFKATDFGI